MSDHAEVRVKHDPSEGFDHTEPSAVPVWAFTIVSALMLVVMIVALQRYFDKVWNEAVYQKVLSVPSQQLQTVLHRDEWDLTHYEYLNKKTGQIRIPLDQAQELFLQEVAAGKPFYPGKSTAPDPKNAGPWDGGATAATSGAAPAGAAAAPAGAPAAGAAAPAPASK